MERTMSVEDKIRRAEEIYSRRRENEYRATNTRVSVDNSRNSVNDNINKRLKKMIMQIIVCMLIYLTFHYIISNNYIFSEDLKSKCEEILSTDISFSEIYNNISKTIISIQERYQNVIKNYEQNDNKDDNTNQEQEQNQEQNQEKNEEENSEVETVNQETTSEQETENSNENIGGAVEISNIEDINNEETGETAELSEEEQMKKDAKEIKEKISFIKPLQGTITSVFGWRNPTVSTVSKYHTGIDIAANKGTDIISATDGKVILSSSQGAYGNHLKIQIEDVIIIYAHCLSLNVKEGAEINQGQIIAKVGSTGNSTGPHLHFEIRREDRYVNPDLILDF